MAEGRRLMRPIHDLRRAHAVPDERCILREETLGVRKTVQHLRARGIQLFQMLANLGMVRQAGPEKLAERKAEFFEEQYKMSYSKKPCAADTGGVKLLTPEYEADYVEMHNKDLYWTGDRVIGAKDRFRTYIALENGVLCGYIDVTFNHEENEIFDLLVKPEYRNRGYGKRLLCKALEENEPNGMILTVNVGNEAALHVYRTVGFETVEHENSLTALFEA